MIRNLLFFASITFLLAQIAFAQRDSEILILHFAAPELHYSFTTEMNGMTGDYYSGNASLDVDTTINIGLTDSISLWIGKCSVSFIIDSIHHLIKNFDAQQTGEIGGTTGHWGEPGSGGWEYSSVIDSFNYVLNGSSILITADTVRAIYTASACWASNLDPKRYEIGCENWNRDSEFDTLSMELSLLHSLVSSSLFSDDESTVAWTSSGLRATFIPSSKERELELINIMGTRIIEFAICPGQSSLQSRPLLPDGIYFARLENKIMKLVVIQ